ncbi:hypothetical protein FHX57_006816 [Paraburkholderia tropica]|uniref:hypothetical protein n=1 Tax=Paraburkholderia tropica TaxID=92647 RepID=UPI0016187141|nr:hypothetical protein [Paraburkholderia tropica]MBB3004434.1 hypothetical protein [Paraburkholderia tropica]
MSTRREYPRVGSDHSIKRGQCSCCNRFATRKVDIQVSWFRGDDEVLQLCELHYAFVGKQAWKELFDAATAEKDRRRKNNEIARERSAQRKALKAQGAQS